MSEKPRWDISKRGVRVIGPSLVGLSQHEELGRSKVCGGGKAARWDCERRERPQLFALPLVFRLRFQDEQLELCGSKCRVFFLAPNRTKPTSQITLSRFFKMYITDNIG